MDKIVRALEIFRDYHDVKMSSEEFIQKWGNGSYVLLDNEGLFALANETLKGIENGKGIGTGK